MRLVRKLPILGLALLLLVGVSCTNDSLTGVSAPTSAEQSSGEQSSFGLIGNLTNGLTSTAGDLTDGLTSTAGGLTQGLTSTAGGLTGSLVGSLGQITDLLTCSPQPYAVKTETIGPKGGKIKIGTHELVIPRDALSAEVTITAEQVTGTTNSVRFSPEGLQFEKPAVLRMTYDNCVLVLLQKKIVYTTEDLKILEVLRSLDLFKKKTVTAPIDHFSRYALAY